MDAVAAARIGTSVWHPGADRVWRTLSASANRGALWFWIAAALFVSGPRRRRAAARGLGSLTVASILANLVGKQVFGGARPLLKDIPIGRRLRVSPTSASFPSGHSASAAAFATGAALESPAAGSLALPLAAGVAYSRIHTGAHWLSDVLGGVGLGITVAAAGKLLVPARPATADAGPGTRVTLPTLTDGLGLAVAVNEAAGISAKNSTDFIRERLPAAQPFVAEEGEDLRSALALAGIDAGSPRAIGVSGGDGSVALAAATALERGVPLLVLPGGTLNHFARSIGIGSPEDSVAALKAGGGQVVDVVAAASGDGTPIIVINTASIGIYPEFVARRERREEHLGKRLASVIAGARTLRSAQPIEVVVDGRLLTVWTIFIGVNRYEPSSGIPRFRRRLNDGVLDVRILHAVDGKPRSRALADLILGDRGDRWLRRVAWRYGRRTVETFTAQSLTLQPGRNDGRLTFAHDGETLELGAGEPISLRVVAGVLRVYSGGRGGSPTEEAKSR